MSTFSIEKRQTEAVHFQYPSHFNFPSAATTCYDCVSKSSIDLLPLYASLFCTEIWTGRFEEYGGFVSYGMLSLFKAMTTADDVTCFYLNETLINNST
jgi:hypothetical protein